MFDGFFRENSEDLSKIQYLLDPILFTLSFDFFYKVQFGSYNQRISQDIFIFLFTYSLLSIFNIYKSNRNKKLFKILISILKIWLIFFVCFLIVSKYLFENFLLTNLGNWASACFIILLINHAGIIFLLRLLRRKGRNSKNILFWGTTSYLEKITKELSINKWTGLRVSAWFSKEYLETNCNINGLIPFGGIKELKIWIMENKVDYIIFSEDEPKIIKELINIFGNTSSPVSFLPPVDNFYLNYKKYNIGSSVLLEIWGDRKSYIDLKIKRLFDIIVTTTLLIFVSPIICFVSLILFFDQTGPILFIQERYGLNGKKFKIFKFRSLKVLEAGDLKGLRHVSENDNRFTFFGKFIRKWSIDELPQLLNVLKGDMSLVGPRPHAVEHNEYYRKIVPGYMQRHSTKPGITGLAQVEGYRGDIKEMNDMENRIKSDLKYVEDWSLYLDLKILIRTFISLKGV